MGMCPVVPLVLHSEDMVLTVCLAQSWAQRSRDGWDLGSAFGVLSPLSGGHDNAMYKVPE